MTFMFLIGSVVTVVLMLLLLKALGARVSKNPIKPKKKKWSIE